MFLKNFVIGLVLVIFLAEYSEAIQCYRCQSSQNPLCGEDNFSKGKNPKVIDCSKEPPPSWLGQNAKAPSKCSKIVFKDSAGQVVKRDCHWERIGDSTTTCISQDNLRIDKCETCTGDLCNSAPQTKMIGFTGMLSTALLFAVAKVILY